MEPGKGDLTSETEIERRRQLVEQARQEALDEIWATPKFNGARATDLAFNLAALTAQRALFTSDRIIEDRESSQPQFSPTAVRTEELARTSRGVLEVVLAHACQGDNSLLKDWVEQQAESYKIGTTGTDLNKRGGSHAVGAKKIGRLYRIAEAIPLKGEPRRLPQPVWLEPVRRAG
ncbi:hypothetical protein HY024_01860 [Candidatus Curtissbacteria bacterium]|nr:hypothetical protein [Candidatus Curtissbacteria bacterium]